MRFQPFNLHLIREYSIKIVCHKNKNINIYYYYNQRQGRDCLILTINFCPTFLVDSFTVFFVSLFFSYFPYFPLVTVGFFILFILVLPMLIIYSIISTTTFQLWSGGLGFDHRCGRPLPTGWVGVSIM